MVQKLKTKHHFQMLTSPSALISNNYMNNDGNVHLWTMTTNFLTRNSYLLT